MPSLETNGRNRSRVPVFRNWTCWMVLVKFWDRVRKPSREPSWISARCLLSTRSPRAGQDLGAAHGLERPHEAGDVVRDEPVLDAVGGRGEAGRIGDRSRRDLPRGRQHLRPA